MNVAKWLLLGILALPVAELVVFVLVAAWIGFGLALLLLVAGSLAGGLLLRHAGGSHIARVRGFMTEGLESGRFTAIHADPPATAILFAGFLLLIPGFITDVLAILLLLLRAGFTANPPPRPADGVVDLEPEQWQRVPDPALPRQGDREQP